MIDGVLFEKDSSNGIFVNDYMKREKDLTTDCGSQKPELPHGSQVFLKTLFYRYKIKFEK